MQRDSNSNADELLLRVTEMMKNQFGLKPKGHTFSHKHPYPEWYDLVAFPVNYMLLEFAKFTGQDSTSTIEHVSRYLTQLGEASIERGSLSLLILLVSMRANLHLVFITVS